MRKIIAIQFLQVYFISSRDIFVFLALLFLVSLSVFAEDSDELPDVKIKVKPNICVAPRNMKNCISTVNIRWTSSVSGHYCLRSSVDKSSLDCWDNTSSGVYYHRVNINNDVVYWMVLDGYLQKFSETTLEFAKLTPHRKYPRRNNRLPWSIQP